MTRRQEARRNAAYVLLGLLFGIAFITVGLFGYTPWNDVAASEARGSRQEAVEPAVQEAVVDPEQISQLPRL